MEQDTQPSFEPYEGHGRSDGDLYKYVFELRCNGCAQVPHSPKRFRVEDARDDIRNLVRAALRDKFSDDLCHTALKEWRSREMEEAGNTSETLAWFDSLSEADIAGFFPRGPDAGDMRRRNSIADSHQRARDLLLKTTEKLRTAFRVDTLSVLREVFGDFSVFMPRELASSCGGFAKFRRDDSLVSIKKIVLGASDAVKQGCADTRWFDATTMYGYLVDDYGRSPTPYPYGTDLYFNRLAEISGLNRRHEVGTPHIGNIA